MDAVPVIQAVIILLLVQQLIRQGT